MTHKAEEDRCTWLEVVIRDEVKIPTIEIDFDRKILVILNLKTTSKELTKYLSGQLTGQELLTLKKIWSDDKTSRKFVLRENGDLQISIL